MKYTNLGKTDIRVSRIPYSPLAGGHLSHRGWESGTHRRRHQCQALRRCSEGR